MHALDGMKVVDIAGLAPGPFCTMILGDMGADVLRIDRLPSQGGYGSDRLSNPYNALMRNKRSLAMDLKQPQAKEVFHRLARDADVVVEGYRPGVAARLGIDYETLSALNPRLVYCSVSGYGQNGPYRSLAGHDINYVAMGGILGLIGEAGEPPVIPPNFLADFAAAGTQTALGVTLALLARERTGRGQYVDMAMLDSIVFLLTPFVSQYFAGGKVPRRGEMDNTGHWAHHAVFETADGRYISIGIREEHLWENLCRALGREEFAPYIDDEAHRLEILEDFRQLFRTKSREEWFRILAAVDTCASPVYDVAEVFDDPHVRERQMLLSLAHPTLGEVRQVGMSLKLSDTPGSVRRLAPSIGQHTDEALAAAGYSPAEIARLRTEGVVA